MAKKETALANVASEQQLAELRNLYPVEPGLQRILLPRLGLVSQDVMEGVGKNKKVVQEAGTFFTDRQTEEEDAEGKKIWEKEELGTEVEGIIIYQRKQLRYYDEATEEYDSSPIYDADDQVIPLFRGKVEVDRGTPKELRARPKYQGLSQKGKPISKLEENRILYVLYEGELYQMNLRATSMYAFMTYAKKTLPPSVLTHFSSTRQEKGKISWNQMEFKEVRKVTKEEAEDVKARIVEIAAGLQIERNFYSQNTTESAQEKVDKAYKGF